MNNDIICFCHLRWNFVYQRPQHLLSRFAKQERVFVIEEPIFDAASAFNEIYQDVESNVWVVIPHLPADLEPDKIVAAQKSLLDMLIEAKDIKKYILWYYSPMALQFSNHLQPNLIIYDCMDELSAFKFAPASLKQNESMLFQKANVVFTGGHHLYEAKKHLHVNIYPFPSSIDKEHFAKARNYTQDPNDQATIKRPRIGFYGVVDERFDIGLLDEVASLRPEWQFVVLGPVVKIDINSLPKKDNIHYLGPKNYKELPDYLAGWDIAMMPFALNESTKFISPTKTPEYLAGGKPVISSSIRDVVIPYGQKQLVHIADTAEEFIAAAELILADDNKNTWLSNVDEFLSKQSWDITFNAMNRIIEETIEQKTHFKNSNKTEAYV